MKKIEIDPDELFQFNFKMNAKKYEYVKRIARATPRGTMRRVIESRVFPRDWRTENEQLRAAQRKLGRKDREFLPPAILKRNGFKVKPGRARRPYGTRESARTEA